nr:translocation/assembly module TamB domain-containing protein [Cesiribacter andamanensis]
MSDTEGNPAYLNGGVFHDGFSNFVINLKAGLQGTKVLNTSYSDNELYYGTAYATGEVEVLGPANNLWITATARSDKGTKIFIPIDFKNEAGTQSFVNFVNRSADGIRIDADTTRRITNEGGIKLDFDLDITPDAYVEIIFDLRAGDIIRGRGRGKLEMEIDTEGDFTMFGNYEIEQGAYNFTLFNVITKEFVIEPGSSIRWDGDPYGGLLDIQARYQQVASLGRILPQQGDGSTTNPLLLRPYPVVLGMGLVGDLMAPSISFNIDIQEYPVEFTNEISGFMNRLQSDEQLLNRQVFNLLVLRQFAPVDYGTSGFTAQSAGRFGSQTAVSSISELLANQFSALASQIDENLEIDVNYTSNINEAMNTFQLRLSYTFLNGRLRITRDGSLINSTSPGSTVANSTANNYIGNWTVEYMLTPDGQYRVKLYNRANFRTLTADHALPDFTQGISLLQTKSFDSFKELFQRINRNESGMPVQLPLPDSSVEELIRLEEDEEKEVLPEEVQ